MTIRRKLADVPASARRFGAFSGVFTPSILTILGVVMYLRAGRVVGNVGLGGALAIVLMAHVISIITGLSISSIATNRTVGPGGAYYIISRSLGGPTGAAIGIPLFFAQALSIAFYIVGFVESLSLFSLPVDPRFLGTAVCVVLTLISLKDTELAIRAQYIVMGAIGLSLLSFFLGEAESPPAEIAWTNPDGAPFVTVFAVFFPAVTGIMAGVSMSGDLRNPRRDLPRGTMAAIAVGFLVYMAIPIWLARGADSQALITNGHAMWDLSLVPGLIYVGVWAATLSSAIGSILAAPRTLQALAMDRAMPRLFARGYGAANEPRIGLVFSFVLAEIAILAGGLDIIAQVLTMFFLATYGVTNFACGLERWAASPSFRPAFAVPWWLSMFGSAACFYVMSIIDLPAMLMAMMVCGVLYLVAQRRSLGDTFGDARHGIWAALVRTSLQRYRRARFHPSNWRPNLIIFGGSLARRHYLAELGTALVQDRGIVSFSQLIAGNLRTLAPAREEALQFLETQAREEFPNLFCRVDVVEDVHRSMASITQSYGVGNLEANTVMIGWTDKPDRQAALLEALRDLLALDRSVLMVRYDHERGFGIARRIDIWWGGLQRNGALMLLLAYLLNSHDRWREAEVRILTVVKTNRQRAKAITELQRIMAGTHLSAQMKVIRAKSADIVPLMREESGCSDLVLIGLRQPQEDESADRYFEGYGKILAALPSAILIASAPSFEGAAVLFDDADLVDVNGIPDEAQ